MIGERKPDDEAAPFFGPVDERRARSPAKIHEALDERQPDTETAERSIRGLSALIKELEYAGELVFGHAAARVLHDEPRLAVLGGEDDLDRPVLRELDRVAEEVRDDLLEPRRITHDHGRLIRQLPNDLEPALLEHRTERRDRVVDHLDEIDTLPCDDELVPPD